MIKIIGINGSPKPGGLTEGALKVALDQAEKEGAEVQMVNLRDYIDRPYMGTPEDSLSEKITSLLDMVKSADAIIIATPVHWFNMSSLTKIFLDHLTALEVPNFDLQGTVAGCIAICCEDGGMQACMAITGMLMHIGCVMVPYGALYQNSDAKEGGELGWQKKDLSLMGSNVVRMATALEGCSEAWGYENMA